MLPIYHIDIVINGILMGAIYALIAVGLNLIYGVSRILNLAHGDLLMLGCVVTYLAYNLLGQTPLIALIVIIPLFFLIGGLINISVIKPLMKFGPERSAATSVIVTLGLSFIIVDLVLFGSAQAGISTFGVSYMLPSLRILNIYLSSVRLLSLLSILLITIILRLFITRTFLGKKIRALSQNREAALALGVDESRVSAITFGLGSALAAIAGVFIIMITATQATIGMTLTFKALIIIILGGMGSFFGAVIGGLLLGLAESYTMLYLGGEWIPVIGVIILFIVLMIRPRGLFGRES
jgi:branched-chain amino acid transport system permease protein